MTIFGFGQTTDSGLAKFPSDVAATSFFANCSLVAKRR